MIQLTFNMPEAVRLYQKEVLASDFIPYACHYNDETILTRNGELIQLYADMSTLLCVSGAGTPTPNGLA